MGLNNLVSTRFRSDALQIIAFGRYARTVTAAELTGLEGVYEQGTNLHHALALTGRQLRRHPIAQPVVLVVTDGEPTAHLEDVDGEGTAVFFDYPPHPRPIAHTVKGFDEVAQLDAQVTIFRLGSDPGLARFIDQVARRVEGRVVEPDWTGWGPQWSATISTRGVGGNPATARRRQECSMQKRVAVVVKGLRHAPAARGFFTGTPDYGVGRNRGSLLSSDGLK